MAIQLTTLARQWPGRLRFCVPGLRGNPALERFLVAKLAAQRGVTAVRMDVRTGRALVLYDVSDGPQGDRSEELRSHIDEAVGLFMRRKMTGGQHSPSSVPEAATRDRSDSVVRLGTGVIRGKARILVTATGRYTGMGELASDLSVDDPLLTPL
ncbi:MAG: hypothetical protein ACYCYO_12835, partial [Bacilli bacterium]